jgi:hypothetical protein
MEGVELQVREDTDQALEEWQRKRRPADVGHEGAHGIAWLVLDPQHRHRASCRGGARVHRCIEAQESSRVENTRE